MISFQFCEGIKESLLSSALHVRSLFPLDHSDSPVPTTVALSLLLLSSSAISLSSSFFAINVSTFGRNHGLFFFLGACRKVIRSLLTGFVKIFQSKKSDEKFRISSLNIKEFLRCAVEVDTASSQQVICVLRRLMQGRKADGFASIFVFRDPALLREAGTEPVR